MSKFLTQLGQDALFYFNKRRTVRNAKYRTKFTLLLYAGATFVHGYYYVGDTEMRMKRMFEQEKPLYDFISPELNKEEYDAITSFYMSREPR